MMIVRAMNQAGVTVAIAVIVLTFQVAAVFVAAATDDHTFNEDAILEGDEVAASPNGGPSVARAQRLRVPAIAVDAPTEVAGLDSEGVMEDPSGPWKVAWYDFGASPGEPGNAIFSGHVDHESVGAAVFWDLRSLTRGSEINVELADGTVLDYRVVAKASVIASDAPIASIVGPTRTESITLITCSGTFDPSDGSYDERLIVRAERVDHGI